MTNNKLVFNVTRNYWIKRKTALKGIEQECTLAWVAERESVRDLTLAEQIAARNEQAKRREPLPYSEIAGLKFDPPMSGVTASRRENSLCWAAHEFMRNAA
jgi:hypothetical protein